MIIFLKKYFNLRVTIFVLIVTGISFWVGKFSVTNDNLTYPVREHQQDYVYINPLLFYDSPSDVKDHGRLVSDVQKIINSLADQKTDTKVSFYYRNLNKGQWVGINEDEEYDPASMLKVVVMMAFLGKAQANPSILSERIKFSQEINRRIVAIPYSQKTKLELNKAYTVEDLINRMIVDSDNGAAYTLVVRIGDKVVNDIFNDLGITDSENKDKNYAISAKNFASFFRLLYNATYINRPMSEKALEILSKTSFKEGLLAGLPDSVVVAHKFGERVIPDDGGNIGRIELHDCGIVYYVQNPYVLCVMTNGTDINNSKEIIKSISKVVYDHTVSQNR